MLIFAVISLTIGILALLNKTVFGDNQHLVIGIFMLAEAVLDIVTYFLLTRGIKKQNADPEFVQPVPVPAEPEVKPVPESEE